MSKLNGNGVDTDDDLQEHLADLEAAAQSQGLSYFPEEEEARRTLDGLRAQVAALRATVESMSEPVKTRAIWINEQAHAQMGDYPWLKLAGAMATAFCAGRFLRLLSTGAVVAVATPLLSSQISKRAQR